MKQSMRKLLLLLVALQIIHPIYISAQSNDKDAYDIKNKTIEQIVDDTIIEFDYDSKAISIAYYDFKSQDHYYLNPHHIMLGASTTKVGTAALYISLINNGELTMESLIPYNGDLFEAGGGNITNGPIQDAYPLYDLIYEMLYYSDNTAWNLLTFYYYENYGNYQEDLLALSEAEIVDDMMYQFNHITAQVLEGILIEVGSSEIYQPIVDIMLEAQDSWLMKTYVNKGMAAKYGNLDSYFHDIGIFYDNNQPAYALVIMTDGQGIGYEEAENQFFGLLNLRLNRLYQSNHVVAVD